MDEATLLGARRPNLRRDATWLTSADLLTIALGLLGQALLSAALIREDYGLLVIVIDAFAVAFLLVDAGLPTIITRDVPKARFQARALVHQTLRIQGIFACIFVPTGLVCGKFFWPDIPLVLLLASAGIAILHIFTYAHRSALRALGEARQEAIVKVVERLITTSGYGLLLWFGSSTPSNYAVAFFIGVLVSLIWAVYQGERLTSKATKEKKTSNILLSNKALLISAIPFAITLGILPLIGRLEKLLIGYWLGTGDVAVFHVAFLAYLAGLTLPQAMRSALLPIMGSIRGNDNAIKIEIKKVRKLALKLIPLGVVGGALLVYVLMQLAFPDYSSESYPLFIWLLIGWVLTMLAVPSYVAVQAGNNPWNFTIMLIIGIGIACLSGIVLIPRYGLWGAVASSNIGSAILLILSIYYSGELKSVNLVNESE